MSIQKKVMSGVDAAWLHMEDPTNLMMVTGLAILDQPVDRARFRRTVEERLLSMDRFRMKVTEARRPGAMPYWESDPNFDLDAHLHYIALPEPGDKAALQMLLSDLASTPVDFSKSPWQAHLVDNVMGGSAMVLRFHHCMGDGTAMNYVMYRLMDTERNPEAPAQDAAHPRNREETSLVGSALKPVKGVFSLSRTLLYEGVESVLHPTHFLQRAEVAADSTAIVARMLAFPPDPDTPFKGKLGVQKRVAWSAPLDLADVKLAAGLCGVKINDILVDLTTGALRRYLLEHEAPADGLEIRAVLPVDLRAPDKAFELGNDFGLVFLSLPIGTADPLERLVTVRARMNALKESPEAVIFFSLLNLFGHTPQAVEEQVVNLFASRATTVFTNVAGPRQTLYLAGSRIERMTFWVPQSGRLGMGISILSYDGEVMLGVITDAGLVPDPEAITTAFTAEFAALLRRLQKAVDGG